ncbi:MAG: thioesterase family protein [Chloroflexota bacterium]
MPVPPVGSSSESQHIVTEADTAHAWGNTNVHVLATPRLLQWIEQTTGMLWRGYRDPEQEALLGTEFCFKHLGPALPGATVTIRASVTEVDRRRVRYRFEAFDHAGPICEGSSENFIMPMDRHLQRLEQRRQAISSSPIASPST